MRSPIAPPAAPGFRPVVARLLAASLCALVLAGCKSIEEPGGYVAGWTLVDPSQRHPIMVSQQPATTSIRIPRGSHGLSPAQASQVAGFLGHYRNAGMRNSRLLIAVPSGSPNESAAVHAVGDMRRMMAEFGFSDTAVSIEPYPGGRDPNAPIRLSYMRFVADGPACSDWSANLADDRRNLPYPNFGCAQQRNLAAQIANPADLLGPRTMTPSDAERRGLVLERYEKGRTTASEKSGDERVQVKGAN